jgi:hypothetical protein
LAKTTWNKLYTDTPTTTHKSNKNSFHKKSFYAPVDDLSNEKLITFLIGGNLDEEVLEKVESKTIFQQISI